MSTITRFINDEQGADLIEYALLAGLISLAAVATLTTVGGSIKDIWLKISGNITKANNDIPVAP